MTSACDLGSVRELVASFPSRISTRRFITSAKTTLLVMADEIEQLRADLAAVQEET